LVSSINDINIYESDLDLNTLLARKMIPNPAIIGIICNLRKHETGVGQTVNTQYFDAIRRYTSARVIMLPCLIDDQDESHLDAILQLVDGIILTGSQTNVHPSHYGEAATQATEPYDRLRDRTSLLLARLAFERHIPILGICRGLQEMNVACKGTLLTDLNQIEGNFDHQMLIEGSFDDKHMARHEINLTPNGRLAEILGRLRVKVNSLHRQGIGKLGEGLQVDAVSDDGVIEAIHYSDHPFAIGVQWHPEYQTGENEVSALLFSAFENAMLAYKRETNSRRISECSN
jgi:putative glutamine amidotransferase